MYIFCCHITEIQIDVKGIFLWALYFYTHNICKTQIDVSYICKFQCVTLWRKYNMLLKLQYKNYLEV